MATAIMDKQAASVSHPQPASVASQDTDAPDFLMVYPSGASNSGVMNAIHALYYLPKRYKLVIMKDASLVDGARIAEGNDSLVDRILFATNTAPAGQTPAYAAANAIIYDGTYQVDGSKPHIVIDQSQQGITQSFETGYTIGADNPEALASAAMLISKHRHATV